MSNKFWLSHIAKLTKWVTVIFPVNSRAKTGVHKVQIVTMDSPLDKSFYHTCLSSLFIIASSQKSHNFHKI